MESRLGSSRREVPGWAHRALRRVLEGLDRSPEPGGFLFGSYAYCPDCAVQGPRTIKAYKEEYRIVGMCGEESFADFVRRMRGPDAYISVTVHK